MKISIAVMMLALLFAPPVLAAGGPDRLNYQGVLRDAAGDPRQGTFDMRFRFYDAATVGNQVLIDEHLAAGTGGVVVTGGLFDVALGSGTVLDGSGPGVFASITDVVGQLDAVWLEIEVGGETLAPRVRVLSSAYALNAKRFQGKDVTEFLDTSATTQQKTGLLVASGGVDFGPGASDDLAAADVATLTGGGNADALHTHALVGNAANADKLDSLDSAQFLRSDTDDTYTSGTLTLAAGTVLNPKGEIRLDGKLFLGYNGPEASQLLYFYDGGSPSGESFGWNETQDRFTLSNTLRLENGSHLEQTGDSVYVKSAGPDGSQAIYFYDTGEPTGQSIYWDDPGGRFWFSSDATVAGVLTVDENVRVNGSQVSIAFSGPDQNQKLGFFDDGAAANESLTWSNAEDRFVLSNDLAVNGVLRTGSLIAPLGNYSAIGNAAAASTDITNGNDLLVSEDLEVKGQLYMALNNYLEFGLGGNFFFSRGLQVGDAVGENLMIGGRSVYFDVGPLGSPPVNYLNYQFGTFNLSDDLDVNGTLTANSKNFVQNHPYDPGLEIVYTTLEGPEAATYTRGSARLTNGVARVPLDASFAWVANPDLGLTVSLTPRGGWADLYVVEVTTSELVVAATPESARDAAFDYLVMGLRVGYEESPVLRPRTRNAALPTLENLRAPIAGRPELARHTPLARYRKAEAEVFGREQVDLTAGDALRVAVGTDASVASRKQGNAVEETAPTAAPPVASMSRSAVGEGSDSRGAAGSAADEPARRAHFGGLDSVSPVIGDVVAGDVLAVDPSGSGVRRADLGGDVAVVGIATGAPIVDRDGNPSVSFAVAGIVTCNVDATPAPIRPGDLLISSPTPGYAMRGDAPAPGTVLGKALEALPNGTGSIRVLVVLR